MARCVTENKELEAVTYLRRRLTKLAFTAHKLSKIIPELLI